MALTQQQRDFAQKAYQAAAEAGLSGPQADLAVAQAIHETAWGTKPSGANNYHGIKAGKGQAGSQVRTHEIEAGVRKNITAKFRDFASMADSFKAWANIVGRKWSKALTAPTLKAALKALRPGKPGGYATDPDYVSKVMGIGRTLSMAGAFPTAPAGPTTPETGPGLWGGQSPADIARRADLAQNYAAAGNRRAYEQGFRPAPAAMPQDFSGTTPAAGYGQMAQTLGQAGVPHIGVSPAMQASMATSIDPTRPGGELSGQDMPPELSRRVTTALTNTPPAAMTRPQQGPPMSAMTRPQQGPPAPSQAAPKQARVGAPDPARFGAIGDTGQAWPSFNKKDMSFTGVRMQPSPPANLADNPIPGLGTVTPTLAEALRPQQAAPAMPSISPAASEKIKADVKAAIEKDKNVRPQFGPPAPAPAAALSAYPDESRFSMKKGLTPADELQMGLTPAPALVQRPAVKEAPIKEVPQQKTIATTPTQTVAAPAIVAGQPPPEQVGGILSKLAAPFHTLANLAGPTPNPPSRNIGYGAEAIGSVLGGQAQAGDTAYSKSMPGYSVKDLGNGMVQKQNQFGHVSFEHVDKLGGGIFSGQPQPGGLLGGLGMPGLGQAIGGFFSGMGTAPTTGGGLFGGFGGKSTGGGRSSGGKSSGTASGGRGSMSAGSGSMSKSTRY